MWARKHEELLSGAGGVRCVCFHVIVDKRMIVRLCAICLQGS